MIKATIIIITYNMGNQINKAIMSVLSQTERNFELLIIDDGSTDNTKQILNEINDKRINYIQTYKNSGKSFARNNAIKKSKSNFLFFTDADCIVTKNWLKSGLKSLENNNCVGVEGRIFYISKKYKRTYSDRVVQNLYGGEYMTANMAYKKDVLLKVGLFNSLYKRNQDRDLALRAKKLGKIYFDPHMIVYHSQSKWTPHAYLESGSWVYYRVLLFFKKYNEKYDMIWRIYAPLKLVCILFPPLLLIKLFTGVYETKNDFIIFFLLYPKLLYERFILWKYCFKEKIFII
ncbi:MAG TPA: glycosyltransferase [Candidatus Sulfotelmatobacter sp.]|jgi:glycosyltransferase involved in cell wall biosynthesis|nr:glycosyltransferase [Candidatus Sulfotelmatobacter sp.]